MAWIADDDYDPRRPEYVVQATVQEAAAKEASLLKEQMAQLQSFVVQRRGESAEDRKVITHYENILQEMARVAHTAEPLGKPLRKLASTELCGRRAENKPSLLPLKVRPCTDCQMSTSIQAICKNTFITFVAHDPDDSIPAWLSPSPKLAPRSRSADAVRRRPEKEELQESKSSQQSLQRLSAVLSVGISSPLQQPQKECSEVPESTLRQQDGSKASRDGQSSSGANAELQALQGMLAKALASSAGAKQNRDKLHHVCSSSSLSTMAPDDASDWLPHVLSSASISTMVSERFSGGESDRSSGGDEVEFELDIEEGAAAAARDVSKATLAVAGHSSVSAEVSHGQVPRTLNMVETYNSSKDEPPTTMMIRNIPGRYSQNDMMADLQDLGLAGTYDFLYIPMDKGASTNVGYAFVNFIDPTWAEKCSVLFNNFKFLRGKRTSNKAASVSVAHLQGLEKNLQHYENAAVNMSRDRRRKPVVLPNMAKLFA